MGVFGRSAVAGAVAVAALIAVAVPASADGSHRENPEHRATTVAERDPITTVASGLTSPFGLGFGRGPLYVAETQAGQVSQVDTRTGTVTPVVTGLVGPSDVAQVGKKLAIITGGADVPDVNSTGDSSVFLVEPGGTPKLLADLKAFELLHNPDHQVQFNPTTKAPLDSLSNPFAVLAQRRGGYLLVADAGGNDVLSISRDGDVKVFFLPPLVTTGACAGAPNNDLEHVGCDPVPTGLAYGPDNSLYVSTLSGLTPGEGRVYVLDATTAEVRSVISGLDGPANVAVAPDGTVYVSEPTYGGPPEGAPPPPNFDFSTVGRIVRIEPDGDRSYVHVTTPTGLEYRDGTLYVSANSLAEAPGAGQVLALTAAAFS